MIDMKKPGQGWTLINEIPGLSGRQHLAVCGLSPTEMMIVGGHNGSLRFV